MTYEYQTSKAHEHDLHDHEFHDQQSEHAHEGHVCSATCDHHQAVQHIDFMEPVERHDHVHEEHEHVHGPNCGHKEYQYVHAEIDKSHVHDEHCGHLDHQEAVEHVDRGKNHGHDEHADHHQEAEHVHGPNCGHVEYEKAHEHVDKHADEQPVAESAVEHTAGHIAPSSDGRAEAGMAQAKEPEMASPQKAKASDAPKPEIVPAQQILSKSDTSAETRTSPSPALEASDILPVEKAVKARARERATISTEEIHAQDQAIKTANETTKQAVPPKQEKLVEIPDEDVAVRVDDFETEGVSVESNGSADVEIPSDFSGAEPNLEHISESPFTDEPLEKAAEMLTDFPPVGMSDILESVDEANALPLDFTESESLDTGIDFEPFEEVPVVQLVEDSVTESLLDVDVFMVGEEAMQVLGAPVELAPVEQTLNFSDFGRSQIPETLNVDWPALAEVDGDELKTRLDYTRTYIVRFIEQAGELDPSDRVAMSDRLIAMLQNMPEQSIEELLPLLEELAEIYELPRLEKLLELYLAGHFRDQNLFTRLFGSTAQDTQGMAARIGQTVLKLLNGPKYVQNSA